MSWRHELDRCRQTDLSRLDLHLVDLRATEWEYARLEGHYRALKDRYDLLHNEKVVSEAELKGYVQDMERLLEVLDKERQKLMDECRARREQLAIEQTNNKVLKDRSRLQADETNQVIRDANLLANTKSILSAQLETKLIEHNELIKALSILAPHQNQLRESLNRHGFLLESTMRELEGLRNREKGTILHLENSQQIGKELRERSAKLTQEEEAKLTRLRDVGRSIDVMLGRLRDGELKVAGFRSKLSCVSQARQRQIAKGNFLTKCILQAQQKLSAKQSILTALNKQLTAVQYDNTITRQDNTRLMQLFDNSQVEISNLMQCTSHLMRQMQYWLQSDAKVKAILNSKVDAYKSILLRFGSHRLAKPDPVDLKATSSTFSSCIRRNA